MGMESQYDPLVEKEFPVLTNNEFQQLVDKWNRVKIMVIGDMIADGYIEGRISRISREAPVLVLEYAGETIVPGGAANVVHNVAALSGHVQAVGIIGDDYSGAELVRVLNAKGADTTGLIIDASRPTITKTRIMAGGQATVRQQVVRIDRETKQPLSIDIAARELTYIQKHLKDVQAVILSDYGNGSITPAIREWVISECRKLDIPCIVDSRYDIFAFKGATVIKQNEAEAAAALGIEQIGDEDLEQAGLKLCHQLAARSLLLTRGAQGMTLFEDSDTITHIPVANVSEVYDVSGAGDTVVAVMALALAGGLGYMEAAQLANIAAGVVVRKFGTATASPAELAEAWKQYRTGGRI